MIYQHDRVAKTTKPMNRINQYTGHSKKHVLKQVIKKMPLFSVSSHLGLVLLSLNRNSDPHPGVGVLEPEHTYRLAMR